MNRVRAGSRAPGRVGGPGDRGVRGEGPPMSNPRCSRASRGTHALTASPVMLLQHDRSPHRCALHFIGLSQGRTLLHVENANPELIHFTNPPHRATPWQCQRNPKGLQAEQRIVTVTPDTFLSGLEPMGTQFIEPLEKRELLSASPVTPTRRCRPHWRRLPQQRRGLLKASLPATCKRSWRRRGLRPRLRRTSRPLPWWTARASSSGSSAQGLVERAWKP